MSNHTDMQDKYCGHSNDIHPIQSQYTKVAAVGRHHKRGGAAFGRATSFVVSFVLALNRVNVVAVTTILVLQVCVIGHHVPCHYDFMFPRRSYHARLRAKEVYEALPPKREVSGSLQPPKGQQVALGGRGRQVPPFKIQCQIRKLLCCPIGPYQYQGYAIDIVIHTPTSWGCKAC